MFKKSFSFTVLLILVLTFSSTTDVTASEKSYKNGWDIDKTKVTQNYLNDHSSLMLLESEVVIQYADFSKNSNIVNIAVEEWSSFGLVLFEESKKDISLFIIEEDLGSNGIVSSYIVEEDLRYILLNNYYFEDLTYEEKVYVVSHEIGHAIGLIDLPSGVGMTSIMVEIFDPINSKISVLDILLMTEILNRDEYHFGEEYYSSVSNLCFADANIDVSDGEVCPGPGGGGGSSTSPSTLDQVISFTGDLQDIIDAISNNNIDYAYDEFMDLYPNEILHEINGAVALGFYASFGGLWLGGSNILPIGGTVGLQIVFDSYGNFAVQLFVGAGIHVLPHADVVAYGMYYVGDIHYEDLEGFSAQISGSLLNVGVSGEYIFSGGIYGFGVSKSIFQLNLGIPISLVAEVQYTDTLYAAPIN